MGAFDLIRKGVQGVKSAPFFSKVDEVLDSLPRNKGTGDEFLREIEKAKGVKPAEIQDRGIAKALKGKPKMTKAEVQKIFESNPPPRVQEKVLSSDVPDYDEWLENKAQEVYGVDWFDLYSDEQKALEKMYGELPLTQYDRYKTPGGENYREILLKLPAFDDKRLMELEADIRRSSTAYTNPEKIPYIKEKMDELARLKEEKAAAGAPYISSHYRADPNLLAHIRVQDFQMPSKGFAVVNTRSGNRSEVFPSVEQAQAYLAQMPESLQGMLRIDEAAGKPKKVLLVDEIQSDWHQEGRKKGYMDFSPQEWARRRELGEKIRRGQASQAEFDEQDALTHRLNQQTDMVPDAPFKKNWHELAMKRVLDYAAENGYDSIAITPGAEQAKRYDLSKHIDNVVVTPFRAERGEYTLQAIGKDGRTVIDKNDVQLKDLDDYIGKDLADKARQQMVDFGKSNLTGVDLEVGGEGMKGFYDKILPDYLNNFGKQYGSSVGEIELITKPEKSVPQIAAPGIGHFPDPIIEPAERIKAHSFDITPQLREEVKTKGLPLYSKMAAPDAGSLAAGSGAATIGSQMFDENNEQQVQNPVHFTENPDAMLLELMQRN
jgi:hypothetical protein